MLLYVQQNNDKEQDFTFFWRQLLVTNSGNRIKIGVMLKNIFRIRELKL